MDWKCDDVIDASLGSAVPSTAPAGACGDWNRAATSVFSTLKNHRDNWTHVLTTLSILPPFIVDHRWS